MILDIKIEISEIKGVFKQVLIVENISSFKKPDIKIS